MVGLLGTCDLPNYLFAELLYTCNAGNWTCHVEEYILFGGRNVQHFSIKI
jgi:hypothetical protein